MNDKAKIVRSLKVERLDIPWRDEVNANDCCIFTMRHMETYFGTGPKWDCGLAYKVVILANTYRVHVILTELVFIHVDLSFTDNVCTSIVTEQASAEFENKVCP